MVNSKLVLAVAGAGKTYYIAKNINEKKRNIVITFTNRNVQNLEREIEEQYGRVPDNTLVMTFSSFVYQWLIKPIEPYLRVGDITGINSKGLDLYTPLEKPWIKGKINPRYYKKDHHRHYLTTGSKLYIGRMSDLFNVQKSSIKKLAFDRLSRFCDAIYIDEVQDFVGIDYDILKQIYRLKTPYVMGVGDFNQHSVSRTNFTTTRPFKKSNRDITEVEYIEGFGKRLDVDTTTLLKSRRVPKSTCKFIKKKLSINIESQSEKDGVVKLLTNLDDIKEKIKSQDVVKIVYSASNRYDVSPITTWSYCKGDTFKHACIILNSTFENIMSEDFKLEGISQQEINKLYVALSRATHMTYLVRHAEFRQVIS